MNRKTTILRRVFILLVPFITVFFSVFYLSNSHAELVTWYKGINPYFYKAEVWHTAFFTEKVKTTGDSWCWLAIVISMAWVFLAWKIPVFKWPSLMNKRNSLKESLIIVAGGLVFSWISNRHVSYAYDEVFSAINFAAVPSFQCLSYYVLPNNHILFNFLNGLLFSWHDDPVATGRFLSMVFYVLVLLLSWNFLKKWIDNAWLRWAVLLSLALQFSGWGFSGQARGYEMLLFCSCLAFFSFWSYWKEKKTHMLLPHLAAIVMGMLTLPSFLYWLAGLLITAMLLMIRERRVDWLYMRGMVAGMCILFLCYLPLLSFSGLAAISDNQYVKASDKSSWQFMGEVFHSIQYHRGLFKEWFSFELLTMSPGYILLVLPAVLLLFKRQGKSFRSLSGIYICMMLAILLVCAVLKNLPFYRNMIAHGYIVWLVLLCMLGTLPQKKLLQYSVAVLLLAATVFSGRENYKFSPFGLYYYPVEEKSQALKGCGFEMKPGTTVFLDNECFYWWYVLGEKFPEHRFKYDFNRTSFKSQDYMFLDSGYMQMEDTLRYKKEAVCSEYILYSKRP